MLSQNSLLMLKLNFSILITFFYNQMGGKNEILDIFLWVLVADYISGVIKALYQKKINSKIGFKGILKKIMLIFTIAVTYKLELFLKVDNLHLFLTGLYTSNEFISIYENIKVFKIDVNKVLPYLKKKKW